MTVSYCLSGEGDGKMSLTGARYSQVRLIAR